MDRYGYEGGTYVSPAGTPYGARALPPGSNEKPYNVYEVAKPIENVAEGRIAPWFGELGLGTQYKLPKSVGDLVASGHLKRGCGE
ncbi:TNT domain-containing protein [Burkholderia diffusa]|uniref:TNT domain-containing protein n=1 Tax=Burkholderia diffusa TaxID=488732 RepID=UPI0014289CEC